MEVRLHVCVVISTCSEKIKEKCFLSALTGDYALTIIMGGTEIKIGMQGNGGIKTVKRIEAYNSQNYNYIY